MPDPTRPVAGAPIESEWGGAVHDAVFTPRGVRAAGGASSSVGTTLAQLQLNTAVDDPGGWLASDSITLPSGSDGLYVVFLDAQTDNGSVGERTRVQLRVNGAGVQTFFIDNNGSTAETDARSFLVPLTAGDVVNVYGAKTGGTNPDVLVRALAIIRIGSELGA